MERDDAPAAGLGADDEASLPAPRVESCGDATVIVDWGPHPRANVAARVLAAALRASPEAFCVEAVAGIRTLAVRLPSVDAPGGRAAHRAAALDWLAAAALDALRRDAPPGRTVMLPVCYDASMAPDLAEVAASLDLAPADVVALHAGCTFLAEAIGFMPGFAYLGGLDPRLRLERRASPRPRVPEGSVAIAGLQTAVYPTETPGGWHLVGRCPLRLFDPARTPASLLAEGDLLRIEPIDVPTFERLWSVR